MTGLHASPVRVFVFSTAEFLTALFLGREMGVSLDLTFQSDLIERIS